MKITLCIFVVVLLQVLNANCDRPERRGPPSTDARRQGPGPREGRGCTRHGSQPIIENPLPEDIPLPDISLPDNIDSNELNDTLSSSEAASIDEIVNGLPSDADFLSFVEKTCNCQGPCTCQNCAGNGESASTDDLSDLTSAEAKELEQILSEPEPDSAELAELGDAISGLEPSDLDEDVTPESDVSEGDVIEVDSSEAQLPEEA